MVCGVVEVVCNWICSAIASAAVYNVGMNTGGQCGTFQERGASEISPRYYLDIDNIFDLNDPQCFSRRAHGFLAKTVILRFESHRLDNGQ